MFTEPDVSKSNGFAYCFGAIGVDVWFTVGGAEGIRYGGGLQFEQQSGLHPYWYPAIVVPQNFVPSSIFFIHEQPEQLVIYIKSL